MDTIKGWLGYGRAKEVAPTEPVLLGPGKNEVPSRHGEQQRDIVEENEALDLPTNTAAMKPVLTSGNLTLYGRFEAWAHSVLPLEPEDKFGIKLWETGATTAFCVSLYIVLVSPMAMSNKPHITQRLHRPINRFCIIGFWSTFVYYEWFVPLVLKTDEHGVAYPRTFLAKLTYDFEQFGKIVGVTPETNENSNSNTNDHSDSNNEETKSK